MEIMKLLHNREFKYYDKNANSVDMVNYIKTVMANNFIEEIYSLCLDYPEQFKQALNEIKYLYSKKLNCFVYPPKDYAEYCNNNELLREVQQ
jgi:hypothetical protein